MEKGQGTTRRDLAYSSHVQLRLLVSLSAAAIQGPRLSFVLLGLSQHSVFVYKPFRIKREFDELQYRRYRDTLIFGEVNFYSIVLSRWFPRLDNYDGLAHYW